MSDLLDKRFEFSIAAAVCVYWVLAFALPFMLVVPGASPNALAWGVFLTTAGYFGYTGIRA